MIICLIFLLFFDLRPEVGLSRINIDKSREVNRLDKEKLEFHKKGKEKGIIRYWNLAIETL